MPSPTSLKIVFMGTPELARTSLAALIASRHRVVAVVSQPDRKKGRGQAVSSPPVAELARDHQIPLLQPDGVGTRAFRDWVKAHGPDIGVVAAFGHILGSRALATPPLGCINVHASLLPRWRGASPIAMAVLHGDGEAGVSIMRMDAGMDTGSVLSRRATPISPDDTGQSLHDKLASLGAELLVETLDAIAGGRASETPQPALGVTYAPLLTKDDAWIDWSLPAAQLERKIRAFHPWPGTRTTVETPAGEKILRVLPFCALVPGEPAAPPGTVLPAARGELFVQTGDGALALGTLQLEGKNAVPVQAFLQGLALPPGTRLGVRASS
jgi:methionyl-tRNA formyltransferase